MWSQLGASSAWSHRTFDKGIAPQSWSHVETNVMAFCISLSVSLSVEKGGL